MDITWKAKLAATLLVFLHLILTVRLRLLKGSARSLVKLVNDGDVYWHLEYRDGRRIRALLSPHSFVRPWLTVLSFDVEKPVQHPSLALFPDSLDPETARRLRIRLKRQQAENSEG